MTLIAFNMALLILGIFFLESKELKTYISYAERKNLFLVNIVISNIIYFTYKVNEVYIFMIMILSISAYIDYKYNEIPDNSTIFGIVIYIIYVLIQDDIAMILNIDTLFSIIIYIVFLGSCIFGFIGGGDIKLFLPLSLILGGIDFLFFLIITAFLIFICNIYSLFSRKRKINDTIALAPYFYISMIITIFLT